VKYNEFSFVLPVIFFKNKSEIFVKERNNSHFTLDPFFVNQKSFLRKDDECRTSENHPPFLIKKEKVRYQNNVSKCRSVITTAIFFLPVIYL